MIQLAQGHPGWLYSLEAQRGIELPTFGSTAGYLTDRAIQKAGQIIGKNNKEAGEEEMFVMRH